MQGTLRGYLAIHHSLTTKLPHYETTERVITKHPRSKCKPNITLSIALIM